MDYATYLQGLEIDCDDTFSLLMIVKQEINLMTAFSKVTVLFFGCSPWI